MTGLLVVIALASLGFFYCAARIGVGLVRDIFRPKSEPLIEPFPELDEREAARLRSEHRRQLIATAMPNIERELA